MPPKTAKKRSRSQADSEVSQPATPILSGKSGKAVAEKHPSSSQAIVAVAPTTVHKRRTALKASFSFDGSMTATAVEANPDVVSIPGGQQVDMYGGTYSNLNLTFADGKVVKCTGLLTVLMAPEAKPKQ
jgi:hypothetical protein